MEKNTPLYDVLTITIYENCESSSGFPFLFYKIKHHHLHKVLLELRKTLYHRVCLLPSTSGTLSKS